MLSEHDKMLSGAIYNTRDPGLLATAHRARVLLAEYNSTASTEADARHALLTQLLRSVADGVWIEPPFFIDYGIQTEIGLNTFINVNCVFLDSAEIHIGANGLIGPAVQLLTAFHPLRARDRITPDWTSESGDSPFRTQAAPIRIGNNVWLGAGTLVMPGVTIGDDTTIGAGSIVTSDIPAGVLAFGQPCRVQREL